MIQEIMSKITRLLFDNRFYKAYMKGYRDNVLRFKRK